MNISFQGSMNLPWKGNHKCISYFIWNEYLLFSVASETKCCINPDFIFILRMNPTHWYRPPHWSYWWVMLLVLQLTTTMEWIEGRICRFWRSIEFGWGGGPGVCSDFVYSGRLANQHSATLQNGSSFILLVVTSCSCEQ